MHWLLPALRVHSVGEIAPKAGGQFILHHHLQHYLSAGPTQQCPLHCTPLLSTGLQPETVQKVHLSVQHSHDTTLNRFLFKYQPGVLLTDGVISEYKQTAVAVVLVTFQLPTVNNL